ncbi:MAG: hypothetical protein J0I24_15645 [Thiomonas arsenitoxydans]|uniref:Uncharacterized protein n=1 Tax=Thiomonas arsenitoxydans (strain DSM 22701 / CIP 110005 / 3As) TaxID=426114 RepID=A0A8I1MZ96_THIA3|nr:hypothetical protein [Thiomonas arsenitoxydans]MBN8745707.1 hypothetical protein [Thiomonas arsenitoxydans]ODU55478.1 MAG: hypothetical protein ABT04_00770 [Granulicella sp. SCN 62-9]
MPSSLRLVAVLAVAAVGIRCATATPSALPFVAPGLWQIVSDVHGPMQQHQQITQEQCWNVQGESSQAFRTLSGGGLGNTQSTVTNTAHQSTVHLHSVLPTPQGTAVQDITLVFKRDSSGIDKATMTGHGGMTGPDPMLNDSFTQQGHWLAATCPAELPAAQTRTLQRVNIPAITALQKLATQLQALDPHPNGH